MKKKYKGSMSVCTMRRGTRIEQVKGTRCKVGLKGYG
jgi:hypothetical protein